MNTVKARVRAQFSNSNDGGVWTTKSTGHLLGKLFTCMHISRQRLNQIIQEETHAVIAEKRIEQTEPSNGHHDSLGRFSSYEDSTSWSLEDKQKEMKSGKDVKPCGRGERRKCKSPQELKYEDTSNQERQELIFPGSSALKSLSYGVVEEAFEELEHTLNETDNCIPQSQINQLKQSVWKNLLQGIASYEAAKKAELQPR